jgi:hypothetical protein
MNALLSVLICVLMSIQLLLSEDVVSSGIRSANFDCCQPTR